MLISAVDDIEKSNLDWKVLQSTHFDVRGNTHSVNRSVKGSQGFETSGSEHATTKKRSSDLSDQQFDRQFTAGFNQISIEQDTN